MTLDQTTTQFTGLMNRADLKTNTALASTFINQSILRIQRELRTPMQEATIVYTIPVTYDAKVGLAIPADFLELIGLYVGSNQEQQLQRGEFSRVKAMAVRGSGPPQEFTRLGGGWVIGPSPALGDVLMIQYYASFPALPTGASTNTLLTVAWDAVVYGALSAACDYYQDERLDGFEKRYQQITSNLQNMADGDELTADAAVAPVYAWPDDGNGT